MQRLVLAVLLGVVLAAPALPAAGEGARLTVAPARGDSTSEFAATFRGAGSKHGCGGGTVTFTWDAFVTLATQPIDADCMASVVALTPPPGDNRVGSHLVSARHIAAGGGQEFAQAIYTIVREAPTPLPAPSNLPAQPTAPASLPCDTRVARALGGDAFFEVPGVSGGVTDAQHLGAMTVRRLAPATMLPPSIGTVPLGEVAVTRLPDQASSALQQASGQRQHMPCVHVELGASQQFVYAIYAFREALISSVRSGGSPTEETVTVSYASVRWEYQLRDRQGNPAAIVTGGGDLGQAPVAAHAAAAGSGPPVAWIVLGVLVVLGAAGLAVLYLVRTGRLAFR